MEQPDNGQFNGIKSSETEMCMWKYLLRLFGSAFLED